MPRINNKQITRDVVESTHFAINNLGYVYRIGFDKKPIPQRIRIGSIEEQGGYYAPVCEIYLVNRKNTDAPSFTASELHELSVLFAAFNEWKSKEAN